MMTAESDDTANEPSERPYVRSSKGSLFNFAEDDTANAPSETPYVRSSKGSLFDFAEADASHVARGSRRPAASDAVHYKEEEGPKAPRALFGFVLLVVALAPVPVASNRPVFWMLWVAAIFACFGLYRLMVRRPMLVSPLRYPVISMLAFAFMSFALLQSVPLGFDIPYTMINSGEILQLGTISLAPDATLIATLRWASYALFFVLCLEVTQNRSDARRLAWATFFIVGMHAVVGVATFRLFGAEAYLGPDEYYPGVVTGTFLSRNSFAAFVGMGLILGLSLLLREATRTGSGGPAVPALISTRGLRLALLWLLVLLMLAALLATASRMGVAATLVGALLATILVFRKSRRDERPRLGFVFLGGGAVVIALVFIFGTFLLDRSVFVVAEAEMRVEIYRIILDMIAQRPLIGTGLDTFEIAIQNAYGPPLSPDMAWDRTHSTYLAHWSELGLAFGSLPMLILLILAWRFSGDIRSSRRDYVLSIVGLAVILQTSFHSVVDFVLEMPANVFLFSLILALAFGRSIRRQKTTDA